MGSPSGAISSTDRAGQTRIPRAPAEQFNNAIAEQENDRASGEPESTRDVQSKLTGLGYDTGGVDGIAGAKTEAAVRAFQAANGLAVDGIVGPQTLAAMAKAEAAPSAAPDRSFAERQSDIDSIVTASPAAAQAMREELVADVENRVAEIDDQLQNLPTDSFSGYVRPALQAEKDELSALLPKDASSEQPEPGFAERQEDIDSIVTASPAAAQAMQGSLNDDVREARIRAGVLHDQLQNLPTDSFSGYVRPGLQAELDEINAQLEAYDSLTGRGDGSLSEPGETYAEAPTNFGEVLDPLNSEGDKIEVDLSAELGVTGKVLHGAGEVGLGATIEQTDDGYVIRIDREAALRLGLDIDAGGSNSEAEASATAGVGIELQVTYRFDSKEEAAQGLRDLVITAGDDPNAGIAAAGAETAADIVHGAAGIYDGVTDRTLGFLTGGFIDNNPVGDVIERGTGAIENGTNIARDEIDGARSRLNAAKDGTQVTGYFDGEITGEIASQLGLPTDVDPAELGLEGSASGRTAFTLDISGDGDITVSATRSQEASGTVTAPNVETTTSVEASVGYELEFKPDDDGGLVRQGAGEITFNFSADNSTTIGSGTTVEQSHGGGFSYTVQVDDVAGNVALAAQQLRDGDQSGALETLASVPGVLKLNVDVSAGAGVSGEIGNEQVKISGGASRSAGTEATFTVNAENGLNGDVRAAATSIVNGDIDEGLEIIGNVEGELTVQSREEVSGNVGIEVDTKVVDVNVSGTATATDQGEALEVSDVTLRDGILIAARETGEFAADQAIG